MHAVRTSHQCRRGWEINAAIAPPEAPGASRLVSLCGASRTPKSIGGTPRPALVFKLEPDPEPSTNAAVSHAGGAGVVPVGPEIYLRAGGDDDVAWSPDYEAPWW